MQVNSKEADRTDQDSGRYYRALTLPTESQAGIRNHGSESASRSGWNHPGWNQR